MSEEKYIHTFNTWNKLADLYQEKFMDVSEYSEGYDDFLKLLPHGSSVLEIACGPGNITTHISTSRPDLKITAIDVAPAMIELAKANVPSAEFEVMDCRDLDKIGKTFDGIISGFCIPYLDINACQKFFDDVVSLMKQDGIFYLSFIKDDYSNSGFQVASTGDGTYVYYYDEIFIKKMMELNNIGLVKKYRKEIERRGKMTRELIYIFRKNPG